MKPQEKRCKGRKPKYLTVERFDGFLGNDFWHLKVKVNAVLWICLVILAAIITKWVVG